MKKHLTAVAALAACATSAHAGGIDRSGQSIAALFEDGNYVEFSLGLAVPKVSGEQLIAAGPGSPAGAQSGNMAGSYVLPGAAYKRDLNDKLSLAVIWDQPYGADVAYQPFTGYAYGGTTGSTATIESNALTAVGRYKLNDRFSVHAGVRSVTSSGEVALFNGYALNTTTETDYGYLVGVAYEIPDIALRAALTYHSEITHDFVTTEATPGGPLVTPMATTLPKAVNLDFQTGIAADTLLTASIRWVDWTAFDIAPTAYVNDPGNPTNAPLVSYDDDTITYSLGVGRRFSDVLSGSATIGYEASTGGYSGNLGPTDGSLSLALGLKYQITDDTAISGGVRYVKIGDATTQAPAALGGGDFGDFTGNSAVAVGLRLSHNF